MANWIESGSSIAGSSVKRILTCCVPECASSYLVATPKRLLTQFQKDLLAEDWTQVANHPQIQVKRIERDMANFPMC